MILGCVQPQSSRFLCWSYELLFLNFFFLFFLFGRSHSWLISPCGLERCIIRPVLDQGIRLSIRCEPIVLCAVIALWSIPKVLNVNRHAYRFGLELKQIICLLDDQSKWVYSFFPILFQSSACIVLIFIHNLLFPPTNSLWCVDLHATVFEIIASLGTFCRFLVFVTSSCSVPASNMAFSSWLHLHNGDSFSSFPFQGHEVKII
jgi:hypothetical protein